MTEGLDLNNLLDEDDEIVEELTIIFTKKNKVFLTTPEITIQGIQDTAKLLAHLIINWAHNIAEKLETLEGSNIVISKMNVDLANKILK
jgi:hypothetical protein